MKLAIGLILMAAVVLGGIAYSSHSSAQAAMMEGCLNANGTQELCDCAQTKFSENVGVVSFLGIGNFRPLLPSDAELNEMAVEIGAACSLEISQG